MLPQLAAVVIVGFQQPLSLRSQLRAAAASPAGDGVQQRKAQGGLGVLGDGPRLGIGHVHGHGCRPQRMQLLHPVQQLCYSWPEAFLVGKQPDRQIVR